MVLAGLLAGCGRAVPESLDGFATASVEVGGEEWFVAVADTPELRSQGLRGIGDLGDLDGMLFEFESDSTTAFTMRGTVIPLDIAFFAVTGEVVDALTMVPCAAEPCPSYRAAGPYRFALETLAGGFAAIETLTLAVPWVAVLQRR